MPQSLPSKDGAPQPQDLEGWDRRGWERGLPNRTSRKNSKDHISNPSLLQKGKGSPSGLRLNFQAPAWAFIVCWVLRLRIW